VERAPENIVFFDGHCGLCNGTVNQLIRIDAGRRLRYAPLQGESARARFPHLNQSEPSTILFWSNGALSDRSEAALRILLQVGGVYAAIGKLLGLIPRGLANRLYDFVARHRYRVFGRSDVCRLPSPEISQLFLP
jgi:predicted DCC family thiol-disulfide oxidoreductase YuxK